MESDEDEDVIFEGSHLHKHLTTSEYCGPELNFYNTGKISFPSQHDTKKSVIPGGSWKACLLSLGSKLGFKRENHEEEFKQDVLSKITNSSLITLEDADFLSNMFDGISSEVTLPTSHCGEFGLITISGIAFSTTLLFSARLPWALRIPSLVYVASNIVRSVSLKLNDWDRKRYDQVVEILKFNLNELHDSCSMMAKSLQFIQEMELIDRGFTLPNLITHLSMKTLPNQPSALLCLPLRQELLETTHELYDIMRVLTLHIRDCVPLNNAVDNASHYLACSDIATEVIDQHHVTLQTLRACMRRCHLQLSEMLRRLALCFLVPTGQRHFQLIDELCRDLPGRITPLTHRLRMAYDYYTAWKVSDASDILCSSDIVSSSNNDERPRGLDLALHSLERHLRATALIIDSVRGTELLPGMRIQLSHECRAIATCWELVEMEMHKLSNPSPSISAPVRKVHFEPDQSIQADGGGILPLYGAWEPDVQDMEILEADLRFSDINCQDVTAVDDDEDLLLLKRETREERLARKRELAAQSKRLYSELQVVLKSKAAEWKEREARVMERLGRASVVEPDVPEQQEDKEKEELSSPDKIEDNDRPELRSDQTNHPMIECTASDASTRFDSSRIVPCSTFGVQASLAAQVRALASQRGAVHNEDVIGDSDSDEEEESATGSLKDI
ncbi:vezatin-like [Daphnia carinata]|uniref:vezatin-like n=1 Tax=Daphnia carinata TaxID=120202 RepID=UPI00257CF456|nr:vezatin-like [Daphnia carinata]